MKPIVEELEDASLKLDLLIRDIHASSRTAGTLELVEGRVKEVTDQLLVAVRGPNAILRRPRQ